MIALFAIPFLWLAFHVWNAPEGYEDETGFHFLKGD